MCGSRRQAPQYVYEQGQGVQDSDQDEHHYYDIQVIYIIKHKYCLLICCHTTCISKCVK